VSGAEEPALHLTLQDLEALKAEVKRLHAGTEDLERRSAARSGELTALPSPLTRMDQAARGNTADALGLTPEAAHTGDEHARAEAQTRAQIEAEAFEGTMNERSPANAGGSAVLTLRLRF
jgi:hypothetical protein